MKCLNCNENLNGYFQKKFCGRSCSASFNGKKFPRRSKEKALWPKCCCCSDTVAYKKGKYCRQCINKKKHLHGKPIEEQTLKEVINRKGSNRYDMIRAHANYLYRKDKIGLRCCNCFYDKHVEICHIKPINNFSLTSVVKEINSSANIALLCPNCHWEFDKGLLKLS